MIVEMDVILLNRKCKVVQVLCIILVIIQSICVIEMIKNQLIENVYQNLYNFFRNDTISKENKNDLIHIRIELTVKEKS